MNNKGFAITGILYTIFILFIMTLFAVLSGLNTRERLMKKSFESFDEDFVYSQYNYTDNAGIAKWDGLYVFIDDVRGINCSAYLKKGTSFTDAVFIRTSNSDGCVNSDNFHFAHALVNYK